MQTEDYNETEKISLRWEIRVPFLEITSSFPVSHDCPKHKIVFDCKEMEERYMILEQMLKDERREGRKEGKNNGIAEGLLSLLEVKFDTIPEELREKIDSMQDFDTLNSWVKIAAKAETMEEFQEEISTL